MKINLMLVSVLLVAAVGCKMFHAKPPHDQVVVGKSILDKRSKEVHAEWTSRPPLTMNTRFLGVCPYCGEVNPDQAVLISGGTSITNGQTVSIPLPGGGVTNFVSSEVGNLQDWSIMFVCRMCDMSYSDYRKQFLGPTTSIRLPIRGESELGVR